MGSSGRHVIAIHAPLTGADPIHEAIIAKKNVDSATIVSGDQTGRK
jgi:hypothetical protein